MMCYSGLLFVEPYGEKRMLSCVVWLGAAFLLRRLVAVLIHS